MGMWDATRSKPLVGIRVMCGCPQGWRFHSAPLDGYGHEEHAPSLLRINLAHRHNG